MARSKSAAFRPAPTPSKRGTSGSARARRRSPFPPMAARRWRSASHPPPEANAMNWMLPPSASTYAGEIDGLYYMILVITGIAFVIVEVGLLWFLIAYRNRPGRRARYTHGNNTAEIVWTAVP